MITGFYRLKPPIVMLQKNTNSRVNKKVNRLVNCNWIHQIELYHFVYERLKEKQRVMQQAVKQVK